MLHVVSESERWANSAANYMHMQTLLKKKCVDTFRTVIILCNIESLRFSVVVSE